MEVTTLNTSSENDNADGMWHIVVSPHKVLNYGKEVETESQQDQLEFYSLPRIHFLHPSYFHTATESSAFSPYIHDKFKDRGLQDQCSRHSGKYGCIVQSSRPHPLAQPGFYSPKIPRSKHCEPSLSSAQTLFSPTENIKEVYSHTLPLSHSSIAVLKQSGLCCIPQRIKTTMVEKPRMMKALISQITDSNQLGQQQFSSPSKCMKSQDIQNQWFSGQQQHSVNLPNTPVSRMEYVWNHCCPPQSNKFQPTQGQNVQSLSSAKKCDPDLHDVNNSHLSLDQPDRHLQSSFNYRYSVYNGKHIQNSQDSSDYLESSQAHGNSAQGHRNLKDLDKQMHHSKDRKISSDVKNNSASNSNKSQVDINSKNVFGQPRVIASLRAACSPHPVRRSTIVEDLKKLIIMEDIADDSQGDSKTKTTGSPSHLQHDSASPSPLMLAGHILTKQPLCRPDNLSLQPGPRVQKEANILSDEAHNLHSGISPLPCNPAYSCQTFPEADMLVSGDTEKDNSVEFPDPLSHLEMTLRRLSCDLVKEKQTKVALLTEVLKLRMSNQYLKEESQAANAQLHKIYQMFNISPGCME